MVVGLRAPEEDEAPVAAVVTLEEAVAPVLEVVGAAVAEVLDFDPFIFSNIIY